VTAGSPVSGFPHSKGRIAPSTTLLPNLAALSGPQRELVRVVRRIQTLTLEINELGRGEERDTRELDARERELEDLRWRLAAVARRTAADDRGAAA
jgi:hypothetical protein